jgi:hypothetical protein
MKRKIRNSGTKHGSSLAPGFCTLADGEDPKNVSPISRFCLLSPVITPAIQYFLERNPAN